MVVSLLLKSLYFFLPAYIANMSPVLFKWLPFLDKPVYEKYFGSHKTWRGLAIGTLLGGLTFYLQKIAYAGGFRTISLIDYSDFSVLLGFLLGFGAVAGDLLKSYYKRKAGIKEGQPWLVFDQIDFVLGAMFLSFFVYVPPPEVALILLVASPILHVIVKYLGYLLKLERCKI